MRTARSTLALGAFVLSLAGAGCGGADSPQEVARDFVVTNGPEKCRLVLPELLERQTGRQGADAVRYCERNVRLTPPARDVRIIESEINEGVATVELLADDREERLTLSKRDGKWRISDFPR